MAFLMLIAAIIGAIQKPPDTCSTTDDTTSVNITTSKNMNENAKNIYGFAIKQMHASPQGAAGLLGIWQLESNLDPKAKNQSSGATGLAQWLGGRLTALQTFADKKGKSTTDLGLQLEYFQNEMNTAYYAKSKKDLQLTDVHAAVKAILMDYEGMSQNPEQWYLKQRNAYADHWYAKFGNSDIAGSTIIDDTAGASLDQLSSSCSNEDSDSTIGGTWGWPFKGHGSFGSEQDFGASAMRQGNFHDGLDFGTASWPGSNVLAVHAGRVIFAGDPGSVGIDNSFPNGLGKSVVVTKDDNMEIVYQEFNTSTGRIKVQKGDMVKTGQVIGVRNTDHLHLGITKKMGWQAAEGHAFSNDGTWLDPQRIISEGMNKNK